MGAEFGHWFAIKADAEPIRVPDTAPDLGQPCEAWACPRTDANDTGLCAFHRGEETSRASRGHGGRGAGPGVSP